MRSWLAEVLRVTANHVSPIKPVVIKQEVRYGIGTGGGGSSTFGETIDALSRTRSQQESLRFTGR